MYIAKDWDATMETKLCSKCKVEKSIDNFNKTKGKPVSWCKICTKEYKKQRYQQNKDTIKAKAVEDYHKNRDNKIKQKEQYRNENREEINKRWMEKYYENHEAQRERAKVYREANKNIINEKRRNKRNTNNEFKIQDNLRSRFRNAVKKQYRNTKVTELIGCSVEFLRQYLEWQFDENMSWDNYGTYWHIDHIRPCASFDLTDPEQQKECFDFTNLQPLPAIDNMKKGAKWEAN